MRDTKIWSMFRLVPRHSARLLFAVLWMFVAGSSVVAQSPEAPPKSSSVRPKGIISSLVPLTLDLQVNSYTPGGQLAPRLDHAADGTFVVVWESLQQDGDAAGAFGQRFDAAHQPLGGEFQVNGYTTADQVYPSIAATNGRAFVVAWDGEGSGGGAEAFARYFDGNDTPSPSTSDLQLNQVVSGRQGAVSVAARASDGTTLFAWTDDDADLDGITATRKQGLGLPDISPFQVNSESLGNQRGVSVSQSPLDGSWIAVWRSEDQDGDAGGIFGQRFDADDMPLSPEFPVNDYTTGVQTKPDVAHRDDGTFFVVWQSEGGTGDASAESIQAKLFDASGHAVGSQFTVNTFTTGAQTSPRISAGVADFVVVWESAGQDGSQSAVAARRLDASGTLLGDEFVVNGLTTGDQTQPAISHDGDRFVVAWTSVQSLGDDSDVTSVQVRGFCHDDDLDLVCNDEEVCDGHPDGQDSDSDGVPDGCDTCPGGDDALDADSDGVPDACDLCPADADPAQLDADSDGVGDVCDVCPSVEDPSQADGEGDGVGDACDVCPSVFDPAQVNTDGDGQGNACDADDDNDGILDGPDLDALDPTVCQDVDEDLCDDCSIGNDGLGPLSDVFPGKDGVDLDGDGFCALGDCDDADGAIGLPDRCGVCGGDGMSCLIFEDGFEGGTIASWDSVQP